MSAETQRLRRREIYSEDPERHRAYSRKWYWENREKAREMSNRYHLNNLDAIKARVSAYNKAHREARNETRKKWRARNPERVKVHVQRQTPRTQEWRKKNPVKARIHNHTRRQRVVVTLDKEAVNVLSQLISSAARLKCAICGKNMPKSDRTIDHVIPLAKGGTGDVWNLSIVHHICNIRKNAKMPDELNFADEAVRNCNTNPRSANTVADAQVEPEIAKTKETQ